MATISRDARCPHSSSSWSPLVEDLVEQHGARGGEIERVDVTDHGDRDDAVADGPLRRRESFSLAAHHEDDGTAIGQGAIVDSRVRRRSDDARARPALPGSQVSVPGADEALPEDRAHAGAHRAGVVGVGAVAEENRTRGAGCRGGAERRSEIAGRAHALEREPGRPIQANERRPSLPHDRRDALRLSRERKIAKFVCRNAPDGDAGSRQRLDQIADAGLVQRRGNEDEADDLGPRPDGGQHEPDALDEQEPSSVADATIPKADERFGAQQPRSPLARKDSSSWWDMNPRDSTAGQVARIQKRRMEMTAGASESWTRSKSSRLRMPR